MSDSDRSGKAWVVSPSEYIEKRPAVYGLPGKPRSQYVAMRDGCRLAIDLYLPQRHGSDVPPARLPTIVILTPYYRRFKLRADAAATTEASPSAVKYRDVFVPRGYALAVVDVRGTGASFGSRDSFRSPAEREDYREIADWIVAQPWSDGAIGATGVSYVGAACDFLASTGHPAVRAIAPLFAVWDTYSNHYYPGGMLLTRLATSYDTLMVALDHDRRDLLAGFPYFNNPDFAGPAPVDEDEGGALCGEAVREHLANFHMPEFITEFRFKDDALPYDPDFTSGSFSPYRYAESVRPDVAVYSVSGWMDGAGFTNGAIARFLTLPNAKRHLLLGPWDHGARTNVSPDRTGVDAQFPLLAEVLRFFDEYLMGRNTGLASEAPVHYFTIRGETWRSAPSWPPAARQHQLFLGVGGTLATAAAMAGVQPYKVDFSRGTGSRTRYERLAAVEVKDYYSDWHGRDGAMLCYTAAPFERAVTFTGHPIVSLYLVCDQPDAAIHVYLEEVEAEGTCRYVTEGVLRALHRKSVPCAPNHRTSWPYHSCARQDAAPLIPGETTLLRFALLPTSWTFRRGSRLRIAIAGADIDHYGQVPHGRPPLLRVHHGGDTASLIELPWESVA